MSFENYKAVIPVRLGSSRVKNKPLLELDGESLLQRKIVQLKKILPTENIIVNTESEVLASIAEKNCVEVHYRDNFFADDHKASFSELIMHVIERIDSDVICWTPCVTPFMDDVAIRKCFKDFQINVENGNYDSLVAVTCEKHYWWTKSGPLNYQADRNHTISQDLPNWYRVNNGLYMAAKKTMLKNEYVLGKKVYLSEVSSITSIDIDTWDDYLFAKGMLKLS